MYIEEINLSDKHEMVKADVLLKDNGLVRDQTGLDYLLGLYQNDQLLGVGGAKGNILKCIAVDVLAQGNNVSNWLVTELMNRQFARGFETLFLYTKPSQAEKFSNFGFWPIVCSQSICFMCNKKEIFDEYLSALKAETDDKIKAQNIKANGLQGGIVLNANPVTKGHRYLIEKAASEVSVLHLFLVSEDLSETPFKVRHQLLQKTTSQMKNLVYHETGDFLISRYTFPAYFIPQEKQLIRAQSEIDALIFLKIAKNLGITKRFVGEEPYSETTALYNQTLREMFRKSDVCLEIVPRLEVDGSAISATKVRSMLKAGKLDADRIAILKKYVPPEVIDFLSSEAGKKFLRKFRGKDKHSE